MEGIRKGYLFCQKWAIGWTSRRSPPPPQDKTLSSTPSGSIVTFRGCKLQILVPLSGDQDGMPIFLSFKLATTILSATRRCNVGTIL